MAYVTGGMCGIGSAICQRLHKVGFKVIGGCGPSRDLNKWLDVQKVDVIVDVPNSSVALAVSEIVKGKNKVFLASGPATTDLTGKSCTPNAIHWTYDTWALANGTGKAAVKEGSDTWFFLTADYAFGHALERDVTSFVKGSGGQVLVGVRHPLNAHDF